MTDVLKAKRNVKLGVSGIVFVPGKGVLLGRRSSADPQLPGQWCTPGGGVEPGETLAEAVEREFKEETTLTVLVKRLSSVQEAITDDTHFVLIFFEVGILAGSVPPSSPEFESIVWTNAMWSGPGTKVTAMTTRALREFFAQVREAE